MLTDQQITFDSTKSKGSRDFVVKNRFGVPMSYKFRLPKESVFDISEPQGVVPTNEDKIVTFNFTPVSYPVKPQHYVQLIQVPHSRELKPGEDPFKVFKKDGENDIINIVFTLELRNEAMEEEFLSPVAQPLRGKPKGKPVSKSWWQK